MAGIVDYIERDVLEFGYDDPDDPRVVPTRAIVRFSRQGLDEMRSVLPELFATRQLLGLPVEFPEHPIVSHWPDERVGPCLMSVALVNAEGREFTGVGYLRQHVRPYL